VLASGDLKSKLGQAFPASLSARKSSSIKEENSQSTSTEERRSFGALCWFVHQSKL
jgi:hypothetical protein